MKYKYGNIGIDCVNSKWVAEWLSYGRESCQCGFQCKILIYDIESGNEYIITKSEYEKLRKDKQIKKL